MAFFESIPSLKQSVGIIPYSNARQIIALGFKPKTLHIFGIASGILSYMSAYDEEYSTTKYKVGTSASYCADVNFGTTTSNRIYSINDDGFSFNKFSSSDITVYYVATGE